MNDRPVVNVSTFFIALWLFLMMLDIGQIAAHLQRIAVALERLAK